MAVFPSPSNTVNDLPLGLTYKSKHEDIEDILLAKRIKQDDCSTRVQSNTTFPTRPTKHTGRLMCCESIEQFILGLGTSRMPAMFAGHSCVSLHNRAGNLET